AAYARPPSSSGPGGRWGMRRVRRSRAAATAAAAITTPQRTAGWPCAKSAVAHMGRTEDEGGAARSLPPRRPRGSGARVGLQGVELALDPRADRDDAGDEPPHHHPPPHAAPAPSPP